MKMTHEFAHCMFEGGAIACPDGLGPFFFQMGKTLTKGGGFKRFLGSAQMDRTLLKKGFPQSLFLHLLPYHIECLFSFMQKLSQEMPQWSMANDL